MALGRPPGTTDDVDGMLRTMAASGMGLRAIARELNRLGVPTPQGGREWRASSVRSVLRRVSH